jgi:hypothetical protein
VAPLFLLSGVISEIYLLKDFGFKNKFSKKPTPKIPNSEVDIRVATSTLMTVIRKF